MGNIGYESAHAVPVQTPEAVAVLARNHELEAWSNVQFRRFMGAVALGKTVEKPNAPQQETLLEALQDVSQGEQDDPQKYTQAQKRLDINIGSTVGEILYKRGHVTQIAMQWAEDGDLIQYNQTLTQVQYNSIVFRANQHSTLQEIGQIEALNSYRIKTYARAGILKDNWYVVPSLIPRDVPEEDLGEEGAGYFLRTMTYANQGTTEQDDEIITQTAFMAGVDEKYEDESFETRTANRHDLAAIQAVCIELGIEPPQTEQDALHGFLIPKTKLQEGMLSFMQMCDKATDKVKGQVMPRPIENYRKIAEQSKEREKRLAPICADIKKTLISRVGSFNHPNDPIVALWEEARVKAAWETFKNTDIDINVGGEKAAKTIAHARYLDSIGQRQAALQLMKRGVAEFVAVGCGGGAKAAAQPKDANDLSWKDSPDKFNSAEDAGEKNTEDAELPKSKWKWDWGICRNDSCDSRSNEEYNGGQTWVGPCEACMSCQRLYDKGLDPGKFSANKREPKERIEARSLIQELGLFLAKASESEPAAA